MELPTTTSKDGLGDGLASGDVAVPAYDHGAVEVALQDGGRIGRRPVPRRSLPQGGVPERPSG